MFALVLLTGNFLTVSAEAGLITDLQGVIAEGFRFDVEISMACPDRESRYDEGKNSWDSVRVIEGGIAFQNA